MSQKVAFIGLGVMGYPMAGHLQSKGFEVCVYNRTASKAESWVKEYGGCMASSPAAAAEGAAFVFACVGNDEHLREVTVGPDGVFTTMAAGSVFVDHTTATASIARELYETAKGRGLGFIDAPVSGGQAGAQNGVLSIMCGGDQADYDQAEAVMAAYARSTKRLGETGSGQLTKMVNQICVVGLIQALAEGLHFAKRSGMDPKAVIEAISKGAAQSWQMDNRHQTMIDDEFNHGFSVNWMRKDLGIVLSEARENGAQLPITALVDQFYAELQDQGGGALDISSLIRRFER